MRVRSLLAAACVLAAAPAFAQAPVPRKLGYQGRLLTASGEPETGVVHFTFALHTAATGGQELWKEQQTLALADGFYATLLGQTTPLPEALLGGADLFLEVSTGGGPLSPRHLVGSVPFALEAGVANSVAGGKVDASKILVNGKEVVGSDGKLAGDAAYSAGDGLELAGTVFALSSQCGEGQILKRTSGAWACAADADGLAGVTVTAPLSGAGTSGSPLALAGCEPGQILKWSGSAWACSADAGGLTSVAVSAPLTGAGTTASPLALAKATSSQAGYLDAADFARFEAKVAPTDARLTDERAPKAGSANYIQNQTSDAQNAGFHVSGPGRVGDITLSGSLLAGAYLPLDKHGTGYDLVGFHNDFMIAADKKFNLTVTPACQQGTVSAMFDGSAGTSCLYTTPPASVILDVDFGAPQHYIEGFSLYSPYGRSRASMKLEKYYDSNGDNGWSCADGDQLWKTVSEPTSFKDSDFLSRGGWGNGICKVRITWLGTPNVPGDFRIGEVIGYRQAHYGDEGLYLTRTGSGGNTIYSSLNVGASNVPAHLRVHGSVQPSVEVTSGPAVFDTFTRGQTVSLYYRGNPPAGATTRILGSPSWHWVTARVQVYADTSGGGYIRVGDFLVHRNTAVLATYLNTGNIVWTTSPTSGNLGVAFRESSSGVGDGYKTDLVLVNNTGQNLDEVTVTITFIGGA